MGRMGGRFRCRLEGKKLQSGLPFIPPELPFPPLSQERDAALGGLVPASRIGEQNAVPGE